MLEAANKALEHSEHRISLLMTPLRLSQFLPLMERQHEMNSR
jgi:hypothetical protein